MTHGFDKEYWEQHWQRGRSDGPGGKPAIPPNPYLAQETRDLVPGTALDAGCGAGAEAIWLAEHGWRVTAVDISSEALARASERAATSAASDRIQWVEADLTVWEPGRQFDLVTAHYAHPSIPQLRFYDRVAAWVAPGGTLLVVGHLHTHGTTDHAHGQGPPEEATATAAAVTAGLGHDGWTVVTAAEHHRTLGGHGDQAVELHDVVVRATRR
jgi:SAM-dependent methyltransferase